MKITIPLRGSEFEEDYEFYECFLNEIIEFSNYSELIELIDHPSELEDFRTISEMRFKVVSGNRYTNSEPEFATKLNEKHSFFHTEWIEEYLIIEISLKNEKQRLRNDDTNHVQFIVNQYLKRLHFIIHLTYSTNVDFLYGVIYSEESEFIGKTNAIGSNMMNAYDHSRKMEWPKIKNLKLIETINWFKRFDLHTDDRSKNNLHRAINAISYLFGDFHEDASAQLFWVMLGIESVLIDGNQNVTNQFKEKSIIILGQPQEYAKKLTKLYDYRSKLVHGSFDIYPKFSYPDHEAFSMEYYEYLEFATSILIALIRELISKQDSSFEFELKLKN